MLFMVMHKMDPDIEAGGPPKPEVLSGMSKLIGETIQAGKFHNAAGLQRSRERVRLKFKGGQRELVRGPLQGDNELVDSFAMIKVKSMDEAIAWSEKLGEALGDVEIDVGPVVERWHLGLVPVPSGEVPLRVLAIPKGNARSEAGQPLPAAAQAKLNALLDEMSKAGVLLAAESLHPSAQGARVRAKAGKHTWTDGPFAESKELIAGFTVLIADSLQEAKAWTDRYAAVLGDVEVDVRQVVERAIDKASAKPD